MIYSTITSTLFLSTLLTAEAAIESDKVTSLPGYKGDLPSTHYSGYLPVGDLSKTPGHLHYWFIESEATPSEVSNPALLLTVKIL